FQLRIGLSLADQFSDHRARRTVADDPQERMQLRAQVVFDVAGVREDQLGIDPGEIAVEREGAFGGPTLVNRHLAGTREVRDLLDREPTHPFGEQQFGRGIEDLLAHFSGRAPSASAPGPIGHWNLLREYMDGSYT